MATHQSSSSRRAQRLHMEIRHPHRLFVEAVDIWGLDPRVARTTKVGVPLIIGHDQNHIRLGLTQISLLRWLTLNMVVK